MTQTPPITIRPLIAADEPEWRRLWSLYLTYYETTLPEATYRTTFARLLSEAPHEYHGLLATIDDRPVGLTHYLFHRTCWAEDDSCYLQDLFTDNDMRGLGVGRALINAVYAAADAERVTRVYWLTQDFNHTARRLYDQVGVKTPFIRYDRP